MTFLLSHISTSSSGRAKSCPSSLPLLHFDFPWYQQGVSYSLHFQEFFHGASGFEIGYLDISCCVGSSFCGTIIGSA
jgi:hypothetical protein